MKRTSGTVLLSLVLSAAIVACGGDDGAAGEAAADGEGVTAAETTTERAESTERGETARKRTRRGASVKVRNSQFGRMLFDGGNRALYLFTRENSSRSRCYGECARAWPPFITKGKPRARAGVKQSLLGTTRRRDGKLQVTYRGQPLYYYVDDPVRQVLCQNVVEFGGTWLVVAPSGEAIQ